MSASHAPEVERLFFEQPIPLPADCGEIVAYEPEHDMVLVQFKLSGLRTEYELMAFNHELQAYVREEATA